MTQRGEEALALQDDRLVGFYHVLVRQVLQLASLEIDYQYYLVNPLLVDELFRIRKLDSPGVL